MFYQGEDILLQISGDEAVDFVNNDFKVLIYNRGGSKDMELKKEDFERVGSENTYTYLIGHDASRDMQGMYTIEVMIVADGDYRTIYKQSNAFSVDGCRIKAMNV